MAHVFGIAEKSFLKRFYSCLLIPLAFQILFIYFMSELLAFIFPIFIYLALTHLLLQLVLSYAMLRNGNVVFQNISLLFLMLDACYYSLVGFFLAVLSIGLVDELCSPCFLARFYYFLHSPLSGNLSHGLSSGIMLLS